MSALTRFSFKHLERLSDEHGLFEHALGTEPHVEMGYCTDDNARLLVVTSRDQQSSASLRLSRLALGFVLDAQSPDGRCRNRLNKAGSWTDTATTDDCWGRSLWGLGTTAALHSDPRVRRWALRGFEGGARQRSAYPHAMAFAALGAAEVVGEDAEHGQARALLADAATVIGPIPDHGWIWPEARLSYANAALAEALIAAGSNLDDAAMLERGLTMLDWLLDTETFDGHLSVTGTAGRGPGDASPQFDQQPIEAAALADACWRAFHVTDDHRWARGVAAAAGWFNGANDAGLSLYDEVSGGCYDGLQAGGVNANQGAESTLALVSTMQRARALELVG